LQRRTFVSGAAALALVSRSYRLLAATSTRASVRLGFGAAKQGVPQDFVGLSYETQQLADASFFAPSNTRLASFFRTLSRHGVLRLGGNTSINSWFQATPKAKAPAQRKNHASETGVTSDKLQYAITPEALKNLRSFLDATNWSCIYGLNLANGTPYSVSTEAVAVARVLGPRLQYFVVGNEPDLFSKGVRPENWSVEEYFAEWLAACRAVSAKLPHARFGAPDISHGLDWLIRFGELYAATPHPPTLLGVTHHYYAGGPPADPRLTAKTLVGGDGRVAQQAEAVRKVAAELHAGYRVTEANTCYHGGKPMVSDTFAAALWAVEYAGQLALSGYAGLNVHGGGGQEVADSLGGLLPGEKMVPEWYHGVYPRPFYTPISVSKSGNLRAEPIFYGLLVADFLAGCRLLETTSEGAPKGMTVLSAKGSSAARGGAVQRTVVLQTVDGSAAHVEVPTRGTLYCLRLEGADLLDRNVRFAGATVSAEGEMAAPVLERIEPDASGVAMVPMWGSGAVVLFHGRPSFAPVHMPKPAG